MSSFKSFLQQLDEATKSNEITFNRDEITPVYITPPAGAGEGEIPALPDPIDGKPVEIEVISTGPPKSGGKQKQNKKVKVKPSELSPKQKECPTCEGTGKTEDTKGKEQKCPTCGGTGKVGKEGEGKEGEGKERKEGEGKEVSGSIKRKKQTVGTGKQPSKEEIGKGAEQRMGGQHNTFDSHDILNKSQKGESKQITKDILEKAKDMRERHGRNEKGQAGGFGSGSAMDKIRNLYEPKIDWLKELKKKIQDFKSKSAASINKFSKLPSKKMKTGVGKQKEKSFVTGLMHPASHVPGQKIVFKGPFKKAPYGEIVLIVALDVSGSIGKTTIEKVFSEMDKIANNFKSGINAGGRKFKGKVYFMTWDTEVTGISEYKAGDWRKYAGGEEAVVGGGGTTPTCIFDYMHDHLIYNKDKSPQLALLNLLKQPTEKGMSADDIVLEFVTQSELFGKKTQFQPISDKEETEKKTIVKQDNIDKNDMVPIVVPFLLIATDGEFFTTPSDKNLGMLYKVHHDSILYLIIDGTVQYVHPKNVIVYESYKI